jgi:hypothetical protein
LQPKQARKPLYRIGHQIWHKRGRLRLGSPPAAANRGSPESPRAGRAVRCAAIGVRTLCEPVPRRQFAVTQSLTSGKPRGGVGSRRS